MDEKILDALKQLERRFEAMEAQQQAFNSRMDGMNSRMDATNSRMDAGFKRMDVGFSQVRQDIDNVRLLTVTAQERHIETRIDLADIVRRIGVVEEKLGIKRQQ